MKNCKKYVWGGVILLLVLLTITLIGCDGLTNPEDLPNSEELPSLEDVLGSLELNGKFVGQNGGLISFSDYQSITVYGGKMENDKWIETEHTGKLLVQNNKIVSENITVSGLYFENGESENRDFIEKFEIALNPDDATTILVTTTRTLPWLDFETTYTNVYIPVETAKPNFDGTWNFGENKLIIKNGNFAIVDDSQVLYSGDTWWWKDIENGLVFEYYTSEENKTRIDGFLARSGKFYICIWTSGEYKILTKISDDIEVDFDSENPLVGKYKTFNNEIIEITDSSVTLNGEMRCWIDDETSYRFINPSIDYSFSFMDSNADWIELGEKETTFEIINRNSESYEDDVIGTETYPVEYSLFVHGEHIQFGMEFNDQFFVKTGTKYKDGSVDFTGTWKLSEKIYENNEFADAVFTVNDDGSWSLMIDGTEMNTEGGFTIDLESSNKDNLINNYSLAGIITDTNKLYLDFPIKEGYTTAFFVKQ